jgi:hypothetical protein
VERFLRWLAHEPVIQVKESPELSLSNRIPELDGCRGIAMTTNFVVENQRLITKGHFPRLILPVSTAFSGLVDLAIGFVDRAIYTLAARRAESWL